jgi:hypothetical protein
LLPSKQASLPEACIFGSAGNAGIEPGIWTYPSNGVVLLIDSTAVLIIMAHGTSGGDRGPVS